MSMWLSIAVGLLFAIGLYQILARDLFRIAVGFYILFNAINLLVMSVAIESPTNAPFAELEPPHADPLVQAMVLTAIVIGFGLSTFLLLLSAKLARKARTLDGPRLREWRS